jgi:CheY-like chemotaxis protein
LGNIERIKRDRTVVLRILAGQVIAWFTLKPLNGCNRHYGAGERRHASVDINGKENVMFASGGPEKSNIPCFGRMEDDGAPRLLVIDDTRVHRMVICRIAEKAGLRPIEAESCAAVIDVLSVGPYCGATLDLSLGDRAGTEVISELARYTFQAPIIIISGSDLRTADEAQEMGLSLGLDMRQPVPKPVDLALLRRRFVELRTAASVRLGA